jgi:hypothetical protein
MICESREAGGEESEETAETTETAQNCRSKLQGDGTAVAEASDEIN